MVDNKLKTLFTDCASAIRETLTDEGKMSPYSFPDKIREVASAGGGDSNLVKYVTFMSEDGSETLGVKPTIDGDDCLNPIEIDLFDSPIKESTNTETFTFNGWSETIGGEADADIFKNITEDKIVYASYISNVRYYTVNIYDEDGVTLLKTVEVTYGADATEYLPTKDGYLVGELSVDISNVTSDIDTVITWVVDDGIIYDDWSTIDSKASSYKVGHKKEITLTYEDGTTETIWATIVGKDTDALSDGTGTARLTFMLDNIPKICITGETYKRNIFYQSPSAKTFFNETFYNALPVELQNVIKGVNRHSLWASNIKTFVLSVYQLTGDSDYETSDYQDYPIQQYAYFANGGSIARTKLDGTQTMYLTSTGTGNGTYYAISNGSATTSYYSLQNNSTNFHPYVVPCFCI